MKVYHNISEFSKLENAIITTGTFDGVHQGHHQIINTMNTIAYDTKGETVLFTFFPHPRIVLQPDDSNLKLLNTLTEKIELLKNAGIKHLIIQPFTTDFSRISSLDFVRNILVNKIGTKHLVIGYDHRFGRNREGSFEHLKEYGPVYGFDVDEIPAQLINDVAVSSTKIRNAIASGDIKQANNYLGYKYNLKGGVTKGQQLGRTLGYPTANIIAEENYKLIPCDGVYAVKIIYNNILYNGVCNIGNRPTVSKKRFKTIEVHILDFNKEIYNENVTIYFEDYLREEKKFDTVNDLKNQIEKDVAHAKKILL